MGWLDAASLFSVSVSDSDHRFKWRPTQPWACGAFGDQPNLTATAGRLFSMQLCSFLIMGTSAETEGAKNSLQMALCRSNHCGWWRLVGPPWMKRTRQVSSVSCLCLRHNCHTDTSPRPAWHQFVFISASPSECWNTSVTVSHLLCNT